jgi:hypothetical protein
MWPRPTQAATFRRKMGLSGLLTDLDGRVLPTGLRGIEAGH